MSGKKKISGKKSIYKRLIFILLVCFLLPFLVQTIYVSGHMSSLVEDKILKTYYKSLENSTLLFQNVLQTQFDMVNYYKSDSSVVEAAENMKDADARAKYRFQQSMVTRLVKNNNIERYRYPFYYILMDYHGNMITNYTYTPYGGYEEIYEKLSQSTWFETLKSSYTDSTVMFSGQDYLNERGTDKFYVATNVFGDVNAGILICATDISSVTAQFDNVLPESANFLLNEAGECMAESSDTEISYDDVMFYKAREGKEKMEGGMLVTTIGRRDVQYAVMMNPITIKGYPHVWYQLSAVSLESIMREVNSVRMGNLGILLFYVFAIVGTIALLKRSIIAPILSLRDSVNRVREGDLKVKIEGMPDNELGELGKGFNMMVADLDASFQNLKKNEEEKRKTEIRLLQNQIKPHFVRNVLNTIRWLAEINGATSVSNSILALSSLLEYNFRDSSVICTVNDEINYVKKYIYLQELRFQNKFMDEYDIEEELYFMPILKLTFQPIVENAIYHGLLSQDGLGVISIKGRIRGNTMEFVVSDNGIGMSSQKAREVLNPPAEPDIYEATENIALWNINQRIKRNYGENYGLFIESKIGEGTSVTVRMPLTERKEEA